MIWLDYCSFFLCGLIVGWFASRLVLAWTTRRRELETWNRLARNERKRLETLKS